MRQYRLAEIFNVANPSGIYAVLPDVPAFLGALRSQPGMRRFLDSPLGLHFLRSVPLRSAAHLHRLIRLAPESWQWDLYALLTPGPIFYHSAQGKFVLVVAVPGRQLLAKLIAGANVAQYQDWLVVASDQASLQEQLHYLRSPIAQDFVLDNAFHPKKLSIAFFPETKSRISLSRALVSQALLMDVPFRHCLLHVAASNAGLQADGSCELLNALPVSAKAEKIPMPNYPLKVFLRRPDLNTWALAFAGLHYDAGHLVPQLFVNIPENAPLLQEFLTEAFKAKGHEQTTAEGQLQIRYPSAASYGEKKYDLFSPVLKRRNGRLHWYSFVRGDEKEQENSARAGYTTWLEARLDDLLQNTLPALRQWDPIYSPGHFAEFRDALNKSSDALRGSRLEASAKPVGKQLQLAFGFYFQQP
ncbi:MAG: hypothetical protein N2Z22_09625 [Turneriella sp.]|nr:hypothetical protein [Turneriella sp.]